MGEADPAGCPVSIREVPGCVNPFPNPNLSLWPSPLVRLQCVNFTAASQLGFGTPLSCAQEDQANKILFDVLQRHILRDCDVVNMTSPP